MMVNVVVLTGAGVSTTAGIGYFKSTDEEWPYDLPREKMMIHAFLRQHPEQFWDMYRSVFAGVNEPHEPTAFHYWVASLEKSNNIVVITQNINGPHQAAGSSQVLELHGASGSYVDVDEAQRTGQPCLFNTSDFPQHPGSVPRSPVGVRTSPASSSWTPMTS